MENIQTTNETSSVSNTLENVSQLSQEQVNDSNLILGKFKTVDDLTNAYKNMESQQGIQSKEIGELRKKAEKLEQYQKQAEENDARMQSAREYFDKNVPKYDKDEYFKNPEFGNLFKEAFLVLGPDLDLDKFVNLTDKYVESRIKMYEKAKQAESENEKAKSNMQFSDSSLKKSSQTLPKVDNMSKEQIDAFVAKYI